MKFSCIILLVLIIVAIVIASAGTLMTGTIKINGAAIFGQPSCIAGNPSNGSQYMDLPYCFTTKEIPIGTFDTPPLATGATYIDENFGGHSTVLSDATWGHVYPFPTPINADETQVLSINVNNGATRTVSSTTGAVIHASVPFSTGGMVLDASNPDWAYYIGCSPSDNTCHTSGTNRKRIRKYVFSTGSDTILKDYGTNSTFSWITCGGSCEISNTNYLAFWAEVEQKACVINLSNISAGATDGAFCHDMQASDITYAGTVPMPGTDFVTMAPDVESSNGKLYMLGAEGIADFILSVNTGTGNLDFEYRTPIKPNFGTLGNRCDGVPNHCYADQHETLARDVNGHVFMITTWDFSPDTNTSERWVVAIRLSVGESNFLKESGVGGGIYRILLAQANVETSTYWSDMHFAGAKSSPWAAVSLNASDPARNPSIPGDLTRPFVVNEAHRDEIWLLGGPNFQTIKRLAKSRSVFFTNDTYYQAPRAAISPDGKFIIHDSNLGIFPDVMGNLQERMIRLETGN